jgi:hypothetical protein
VFGDFVRLYVLFCGNEDVEYLGFGVIMRNGRFKKVGDELRSYEDCDEGCQRGRSC